MKCHNAGEVYYDGVWYCKICSKSTLSKLPKRKRPLTDWERMKLGFYRSEKKWLENIKDRKIVTDKHGRKVVVSHGQVIPNQPREYWPKPKQI